MPDGRINNTRPIGKFKHTAEEIREAWNVYISYCQDFKIEHPVNSGKILQVSKPRIPTIGEFCERAGIKYRTWKNYQENKGSSNPAIAKIEYPEELVETIAFIMDVIEGRKVAGLINGEGNTQGLIFDLKANYGYSDKQTIEHEGLDNNLTIKVIDSISDLEN
jgi:hypothetical protein